MEEHQSETRNGQFTRRWMKSAYYEEGRQLRELDAHFFEVVYPLT